MFFLFLYQGSVGRTSIPCCRAKELEHVGVWTLGALGWIWGSQVFLQLGRRVGDQRLEQLEIRAFYFARCTSSDKLKWSHRSRFLQHVRSCSRHMNLKWLPKSSSLRGSVLADQCGRTNALRTPLPCQNDLCVCWGSEVCACCLQASGTKRYSRCPTYLCLLQHPPHLPQESRHHLPSTQSGSCFGPKLGDTG